MKTYLRRIWIISFLFVLLGTLSWSMYLREYHQRDKVSIHHFPKKFDGWESRELIITEEEYAILETRNAFTRLYTNKDGRQVYLLLVYSQNNRKVSHPPEICYKGSGVDVLNQQYEWIDFDSPGFKIKANRLLLEKGRIQQVSYYWFKVGEVFTASYWKQQFLIALNSVFGRPASSALIRISAVVENGDEDQAARIIEDFTRQISSFIYKYLP